MSFSTAMIAVLLPAGAMAMFEGSSFEDCNTKCLANDYQCDGFDAACNITQICDFQCSCVQHCDESNESWSFSLCNDYLKTCIEQAPEKGYGHLDCWDHTCKAYYAKVKEERAAGEWQGLGGWQVFGAPLPQASEFLHSAGFTRGAVATVALLAVAVPVTRLVSRRRDTIENIADEDLLMTSEDEEAACVE